MYLDMWIILSFVQSFFLMNGCYCTGNLIDEQIMSVISWIYMKGVYVNKLALRHKPLIFIL